MHELEEMREVHVAPRQNGTHSLALEPWILQRSSQHSRPRDLYHQLHPLHQQLSSLDHLNLTHQNHVTQILLQHCEVDYP